MIANKLTSPISTDVKSSKKAHLLKMPNLERLAGVCAIVTAMTVLSAYQAFADDDDRNQQILPFQTITESTIPTNGDVNPYGVAFVPQDFPAGGALNPGDLLVSNLQQQSEHSRYGDDHYQGNANRANLPLFPGSCACWFEHRTSRAEGRICVSCKLPDE